MRSAIGAAPESHSSPRRFALSYGGYVEQLTDLLFLKMADERSQSPYNQPSTVPAEYAGRRCWPRMTSLDIFWLKDDSLADSDNLPAPGVIALEIVEDLQAALVQFKLIAGDLGEVVEE